MNATDNPDYLEALSIGGHPRDGSGTDWREILLPSPFGSRYVAQAVKEDAYEIVRRWNAHGALLAACEALIHSGEDKQPAIDLAIAALRLARGAS